MSSSLTSKIDRFEVYLDYGTEFNKSILNELYLPIIGLEATGLYCYLFEQVHLKKYTSLNISNQETLMNNLKLNEKQLLDARKQLESIGLLKTYVKDEITSKTLVFYLKATKTYQEFIKDPFLNELIKKCLAPIEYKKLLYKFTNFMYSTSFKDVSERIDYLLKKHDIQNVSQLDLHSLYKRLIEVAQLNVVLSEEVKLSLASYCKNHTFTDNDIFTLVKDSLVLSKDKSYYEVSYPVLQTNFEKIKLLKDHKDLKFITKVNRNFEIFAKNASLSNYSYVLNDYHQINSDAYILSITKEELSEDTKKMLKQLRKQFMLPDPIINVIVDYSFFKNSGKLISKYIISIAKSVNNLGIETVESIVEYLQCVANSIKPSDKLLAKWNIRVSKKDTTSVVNETNSEPNNKEENLKYPWSE